MQLEMIQLPDDALDHCDLATIAREIFQYQVTEALKVMCNIGALHTDEQRLWCIHELRRLLDQLCAGDMA